MSDLINQYIPYGTQLSLWDDMYLPYDKNIVFTVTYCQHGCPFNGVYEARDKESTVFAQQFGLALQEPIKYLLTVRKDKAISWGDRITYYIAEDMWEAFRKIKELTGRNPLWRMSDEDEHLSSNFSSQGAKC